MLCLTRRLGEKILIGGIGGIVIEIVEIKHSAVRVAITAPKDVSVDREEVAKRKALEKAS
jgi:carbon storage regulator